MDKKHPKTPEEVCSYCGDEKACAWTVKIGAYYHPMCDGCCVEAEKDSFSYSMRKEEDRRNGYSGS